MIFQNCTLYPQMSVYENMAFGLKLKHLPQKEIDCLVRETAEILDLAEVLDCMPEKADRGPETAGGSGACHCQEAEFSDGQTFSVRMKKTREDMQNELLKLYERMQTTAIYATGDPWKLSRWEKRSL